MPAEPDPDAAQRCSPSSPTAARLQSVVSLALGGPGVLSTDIAQRSLALALHPKAEASCQPGVCEAHMHLVPMFQVTRVPDSLTKVRPA